MQWWGIQKMKETSQNIELEIGETMKETLTHRETRESEAKGHNRWLYLEPNCTPYTRRRIFHLAVITIKHVFLVGTSIWIPSLLSTATSASQIMLSPWLSLLSFHILALLCLRVYAYLNQENIGTHKEGKMLFPHPQFIII